MNERAYALEVQRETIRLVAFLGQNFNPMVSDAIARKVRPSVFASAYVNAMINGIRNCIAQELVPPHLLVTAAEEGCSAFLKEARAAHPVPLLVTP